MNFANILFDNPAAAEQARALVEGDKVVSFATLLARTGRLAAALQSLGIASGDRVAILLGNGIEYVELYMAIVASGAIVVPLNTRLTPQEHVLLMRDAEAKAMFTAADGLETLKQVRDGVAGLKAVVVVDGAKSDEINYEKLIAGMAQPASCL